MYLLSSSIANVYFQMWVSAGPQRRVSVTGRDGQDALGSTHTLAHTHTPHYDTVWLNTLFTLSAWTQGETAVHVRKYRD